MEKFSERQRCVGSVTGPQVVLERFQRDFQNDPFAKFSQQTPACPAGPWPACLLAEVAANCAQMTAAAARKPRAAAPGTSLPLNSLLGGDAQPLPRRACALCPALCAPFRPPAVLLRSRYRRRDCALPCATQGVHLLKVLRQCAPRGQKAGYSGEQ